MSLTVIIGCMFSGKTTTLLNNITPKSYVINSSLDTRTTDYIKSHNNIKYKAHKCSNLNFSEYKLNILQANYDTIIIDEGQFFPNLVDSIKKLLSYNFNIIIAGLDADSNQNKFGEILDLILIADKTIKLTGKCHICNETGAFTKRINKNNTEQILVGNENNYKCVCRKHL
jgi:thymidine kinase